MSFFALLPHLNRLTEAHNPIQLFEVCNHFVCGEFHDHRVRAPSFCVNINDLDRVSFAKHSGQLLIKPNLQFLGSQTQVELEAVNNHGPGFFNSLKIGLFVETRYFLNFLVNLLSQRVKVSACKLALCLADPLKAVPKEFVSMLVNIRQSILIALFLEIWVHIPLIALAVAVAISSV